ncbi:Tetratricopeptide repeat protein 5 [Camellia lanceoleosa]|uniref:Tetratricopeptide repeat protein 5 n=1 Tax=Camellia lanceoleosa TaxID=1840588 RepID=A0ACC0HYH7_9ERIC|nr:Tetratricopeptide repeat protein 5 [Camellia lanceoleosa]
MAFYGDEDELDVDFVQIDVRNLRWRGPIVDTVVMNPSFGTRKKGANMDFLFATLKILDVFPDYRKEAEDHLSKAVKLNPSLADAWLYLGNCIWKKGDLPSAKSCFTLTLSKITGPNKKIFCQLSMLERRMAQCADNQAEIVEESIKHAKEAIMLDVKDGDSWCGLCIEI